MKEIEKYEEIIFENIKHVDENGVEYWEARELQKSIRICSVEKICGSY